jgi:inner membrane protein
MDPPTHGLLGAVIGQAFFARTLGRRALGWGAALNMLPDVDVVAIPLLGGLAEWRYHRTVTHGLAVLAVAGLFIGWALSRRHRDQSPRAWMALAVLALLAHPLADAFTSYGTVLLWPSDHRYAWDAVPIVDVFFTGALLLALVLGWIWRARTRAAALAAAGALLFVIAYDAYGLALNGRAEREARRQVEATGRRPEDVHAYPVLLLPWLRRVVVREGPGHDVGWVSTWSPRPIQWYTLPSAQGPLVDEARRLEDVRMFEWFAMGQTRATVAGVAGESAGGEGAAREQRVDIDDLRYGFPNDPQHGIWGVRVLFDDTGAPAGGVHRVQRGRPSPRPMARWLWRATFTGETRLEAPLPSVKESTR